MLGSNRAEHDERYKKKFTGCDGAKHQCLQNMTQRLYRLGCFTPETQD